MADAAGAVPHVQGIAFPAQDLLVTSAIDGTMMRWNLTDDSSERSIEAPPTFTMGTVLAHDRPHPPHGTSATLTWRQVLDR